LSIEAHLVSEYLDTEGRIIMMLARGAVTAGEIYRLIGASQPAVSKKLARLQDKGVISCERDSKDRRVVWYALSSDFKGSLYPEDAHSLKSPQV